MSASKINVISGLLCDDIRREDNGKLILLGVYEQDIQFQTFPSSLSLRPLLIADVLEPGEFPVDIMATLDEKILFTGRLVVKAEAAGRAIMPLPPTIINFEKGGIFRLDATPSDGIRAAFWSGEVKLREQL